MIVEWLEAALTPCRKDLRDLGYRTELVAIGARYRRCRAAWADHLMRSRRAIERAIVRAPGRETVMVLGSGRLLDVPLEALAAAFRRVVLVDALHPLSARARARRYRNVELRGEDVTGTIAALHRLKPGDPLPPVRPYAPLYEGRIDLVVSLNLLSQLGVLPAEWIERRLGQAAVPAADAFCAALARTHLDDLARCRASVCLIADVEWQHVDFAGAIMQRDSSIFGLAPPVAAEEWLWNLAPAPESDPRFSEVRRVIVVYDPGKPAAGK
jgi:hypothetical protein